MSGISTWYRISAQTGVAWVLKPEGRLHGELVNQLRCEWQRLRETAPEVRVRVELAAVESIDPSGERLLAEMASKGVHIDPTDRPNGWPQGRQGPGRMDESPRLRRIRDPAPSQPTRSASLNEFQDNPRGGRGNPAGSL